MSGRKDDQKKGRWDLLPWEALDEVVKVLTHGAERYAPENWRLVEGWRWRYLAALLRHVTAWARGRKFDEDSGLPHLAHAICCGLFLLELDKSNGETNENERKEQSLR